MANNTAKSKDPKRMAKEDRSDGKFWAEGGRERILNRYVALMADAMAKGWRPMREVIKLARREFDYHVDWRLQDHEEPPQPFRQWTPETAREQVTLTPEEEKERAIWSEKMNGRIRRWLTYRATKLVKMYNQTRAVDIDDPYVRLIGKFLKIERPPKARQASQEWSHEKYDSLVRATVNKEWAAYKVQNGLADDLGVAMGFRGDVTRRLFKELVPVNERGEWKRKAEEASKILKAEYKATMNAPYPQDPESRQRAINNFTKFITPLLEGCAEIMGLKIICIAGGPMPRFGGAIRTIGIPIGVNKDAIPSSFAEYNTEHYAAVLDVFKNWLGTCYDAQDISEARLGDENEVDEDDTEGITPLLARLREVHENIDYGADDEVSDKGEEEDDEERNEEDEEDDNAGRAAGKAKKRARANSAAGARKRRAAVPKVGAVKENAAKKTKATAATRSKNVVAAPATQVVPVEPAIANSQGLLTMGNRWTWNKEHWG
ncbi:hypothetical protein BDZ89DRAFT_1147219 [Hymenopellis radicata]|nr:hypothetical protein BDZ89DRAFT_1147219 [Hymenopellis radicata]